MAMENASNEDLVQVPASLLNTLIASVESLRKDVSDLRNEKAVLQSDVRLLQQHSGVAFPFFPRLPIEIRQAVWRFELAAPQVRIIGRKYMSHSRISYVMQSCKEPEVEGLKLKLSFYQFDTTGKASESDTTSFTKQYMNVEFDTIWLLDQIVPRYFEFVCGCCLKPCFLKLGMWSWGADPILHPLDLKYIAMTNSTWREPRFMIPLFSRPDIGPISVLCRLKNVKELWLIVNVDPIQITTAINFVKPHGLPYEVLTDLHLSDKYDICATRPNPATSGDEAARHMENCFREFKEHQLQGLARDYELKWGIPLDLEHLSDANATTTMSG